MDYFGSILGQKQAIEAIRNAFDEEKVSHAYVFLGPAGVGKMTTARAFASHLLASADVQADLLLGQNVHPDLLIIEKEENKSLIGIEQIIKVMEPWLAVKPFRSAFRVVIIRDAQLLSEPAGNALLKVLEDPPPYGLIILVSDAANLMETILSRCQIIRFFPLAEQTIAECLVALGVDKDTAEWAAQLGQGSLGKALRFASEESLAPLWDKARRMVEELCQKSSGQIFNVVELMEKYPEIIGAMIETVLRDICVYKLTGEPKLLAFKDNIDIAGRLSKVRPQQIMHNLARIAQLRRHYGQNVNPLLINIHVAYAVYEALQQG